MSVERDWEQAKEQIRDRLDISEVVRDYVRLEQKGKRYWALCPFHNEDTPSFAVTPEMGIFKCFGCGKGGDVFSFVMEMENCEFPEAMRQLAERTGVELPESKEGAEVRSRRQQFFELNRYAADKYRYAFNSDVGKKAREYMLERGFSEETLEEFEIGYAPPGWDNLLRALKRDGRDVEKAHELGLISVSNDNVFDMFRDRVIFPIHDLSRRVVGFGGRALDTSDDTPKYLNTPETPIFSKSHLLYGLCQARSRVREQESCLIMEGYTDVMRCHEEGFENAVAALGTALTASQVQLLKRYIDELVLVYDGDEAGKQAARRGGEVALDNGVRPRVVILPEGSDPADVLADSSERFRELLDNARPFLQVLYDWLCAEIDVQTATGKEKIINVLMPLIDKLPGQLQKEEAIKWLATRMGADEAFLFQQLSSLNRGQNRQLRQRLQEQSGQTLEEIFFVSLAQHPEKFEDAINKISKKDFSSKRSKVIIGALFEIKNRGEQFSPQKWLKETPAEHHSYLAGLLSNEESAEFAADIDPLEVATMVKNKSIRRERSELARALSKQDKESDPGSLDEAKKALLEQTIEMKRQEEQDI